MKHEGVRSQKSGVRIRILSSVFCLLSSVSCLPSSAAWRGFPVSAEASNHLSWATLATNDYAGQLIAAVNERRIALDMARLEIVEQWSYDDGLTQIVVSVDGFTYTNVYLKRAWATVTNQTAPFGVGTNTIYPHVTSAFLGALADAVVALYGGGLGPHGAYFCDTNAWADGNLNYWFAHIAGADVPMALLARTFQAAGVGQVQQLEYDTGITNWILDGHARFTHQPPYAARLELGRAVYACATNGTNWLYFPADSLASSSSRYWGPLHLNEMPLLVWTAASTSAVGGAVTVSGTAKEWDVDHMDDVAAQATYIVTGPTTVLDRAWAAVTNIALTNAWDCGDTVSLVYTSRWVGYIADPVLLAPVHFDELQVAVSALREVWLPARLDACETNVWHPAGYGGDEFIFSDTNATPDGAAASLDSRLAPGNYYDFPPIRHYDGSYPFYFPEMWLQRDAGVYTWVLEDNLGYVGDWRRFYCLAPDPFTNAAVAASMQTYMARATNSTGRFSARFNAVTNSFSLFLEGYVSTTTNTYILQDVWGDDFVTPTGVSTSAPGGYVYGERYYMQMHQYAYFDLAPLLEYK